MRRRLSRAVVAVLGVTMAACSSTDAVRAPLPPRAQVVEVTISDNHYDYDTRIRPGRTVFVGHNVGKVAHTMLLFKVPDDLPPVDVQIHGTQRHQVDGLAGTRVQPGAVNSFAVDLAPNQRYYMLDFDFDTDHKTFATKGLDSEFRAR